MLCVCLFFIILVFNVCIVNSSSPSIELC